MKFQWQARQAKPIINNCDIMNFHLKNAGFFIKLEKPECLCLASKTYAVLRYYAFCETYCSEVQTVTSM